MHGLIVWPFPRLHSSCVLSKDLKGRGFCSPGSPTPIGPHGTLFHIFVCNDDAGRQVVVLGKAVPFPWFERVLLQSLGFKFSMIHINLATLP